MDYYETGTQGHPEPDIKSDGFHSFDKDGWISVKKALARKIIELHEVKATFDCCYNKRMNELCMLLEGKP